MIRAFVTFCLVANPTMCLPPVEIVPQDNHTIVSPIECMVGGLIFFSQPRPAASTEYFAKVFCKQEGDGSDIISKWVAEEKDRTRRLAPQTK